MEDIKCWEKKFESCYYSDRLLTKLSLINKTKGSKLNLQEIKKAIYYAKKYHLRHEVVVKSCLNINGSIDKSTGITQRT